MKTGSRMMKTVQCFVMIVCLCGCMNSRELNELGIVLGVGIDKGDESGTVKITAQVVKAGEIASTGKNSGGIGGKAYVNFTDTGNTVFSAVRDITTQSSRKLYFPHNQVLILGRSAAEDGVTKYLDFFMRDPETRLNVYILVADGSAEDALATDPQLEKVPANAISKLVEGEAKSTSQAMAVELKDFKDSLMVKTNAPVAPIVEISDDGEKKTAKINGTAVFKGDRMVGALDKTEGRGLLWVLGKVEGGIIETTSSQGNPVSLEIVRAKGKFSPELVDGKVRITITISEEGNIGEEAGTENLTALPEVAFLEKQKGEVIKNEVTAAIKKAQELHADIFGFGESIHHKYPEEWTAMEDQWDELFSEIEVEVKVEAKLRLSGRISAPAVPK